MEQIYFVKHFSLSIAVIAIGIIIKIYLRKSGIADLRRILGIGVFWLKFFANVMIIAGIVSFVAFLIAFCFYLEYEGIL